MLAKEEKFFPVWFLFGPAIALLTLFVAFCDASPLQKDLASLAFLGIPICWLLRNKGTWVTCILLFSLVGYSYFTKDKEFGFDQLSLAAAMGLSFIVTSRSRDEVDNFFESLHLGFRDNKTQVVDLERKIKSFEEHSKLESEALSRKYELTLEELTQSEKMRKQMIKDSEKIKQQLLNANKRIEEQSATIQGVKDTLTKRDEEINNQQNLISEKEKENLVKSNELKHEVDSLKLYCENYTNENSIRNQQIIELNQRIQELASYQTLYKQLREQFDEKSAILSHTRQELFKAQEKVTLLAREKEEFQEFAYDEYQNLLIKEFLKQDRYFIRLERSHALERDALTSIITKLLRQD